MKGVLLAVAFSIGLVAGDRESVVLVDAYLPNIGAGWERRADAGRDATHSWVNFDSNEKPGEVLACVFWNVRSSSVLIGGPIGQASIEMFLSDGSARLSGKRSSSVIADTVRYRTLPIVIKAKDVEHRVEAIEYTYVYEKEAEAPGTMAHGYCFLIGTTAVFIQHTASRPITSELAFDTAEGCMINLLGLSSKPLSVSRGKILRSFD